jgi:Transposase domain (DUF772)
MRDGYLRRLLVVGATAVLRMARQRGGGAWIMGLLERKKPKAAAVALANKTAHMAWALMFRKETYTPATGDLQEPDGFGGFVIRWVGSALGREMRDQAGFFDVDERLKELSAKGDALERLNAVVDFELFRADLERAVPRSDRSKGGRPPFDHVLMFKALILQARHNLSDERTEYLIRDRLSFMRLLGLGLADTVPDANTIWTFREALTRARIANKPAIDVVFARFEAALAAAGFLAMSGQIVDASIVAAPKQRNTEGEKRDIKEGRFPTAWAQKPAKLRQKDRDARWTVKYTKAKPSQGGAAGGGGERLSRRAQGADVRACAARLGDGTDEPRHRNRHPLSTELLPDFGDAQYLVV